MAVAFARRVKGGESRHSQWTEEYIEGEKV